MGRYVEKNLYEGELIVKKARRSGWGLFGRWVFGILFCWLLLIPLIIAIKESVKFSHTELAVTTRRVIRKSGIWGRKALEVPLSKVLNVYVETTFWGNVFNVNTIYINVGKYTIMDRIHDAEEFKNVLLGEMERYEESRLARHADWTAQASARELQQDREEQSAEPRKSELRKPERRKPERR